MSKILTSFILTSLAGLSTLLGYFVIFFKGDKDKIICFSLSFASGVMVTISVIDLIPSSFSYLFSYQLFFRILIMAFFFVLGVFLSFYLSFKIDKKSNNSLKKVGMISMLAIVLHNIPEGIITFLVSSVNVNLGIKLSLAISLHNIPEGISIAVPLYYATGKKLKVFFVVLLSSLSEILGAILCFLFLKNIINDFFIGICFSLIAGIMINISFSEILPEAFKYHENKICYLGFILGVIVMIISHGIL